MKLAVALAVVISSSAFAAPTDELLKERTKKSASVGPYGGVASYGGAAQSFGASYGAPCAGGAPLAPIALYLAPQSAPHYREEEMEEEHNEHARSYGGGYGASGSAISLSPGASAVSLASAASSGAIGYFPHSSIGQCGVPLLLSCSPSVVAGHLAKTHGYAAPTAAYGPAVAAAIPAYKQVEKQEETTELKEAMEKSWAEAEREANDHHHQGHHHHHLIGLTDHHDALGEHTHNHEHVHHNHHTQNQNHNGPI